MKKRDFLRQVQRAVVAFAKTKRGLRSEYLTGVRVRATFFEKGQYFATTLDIDSDRDGGAPRSRPSSCSCCGASGVLW